MSVAMNTTGGFDAADYGDFEYQHTTFSVRINEEDTTGSPARVSVHQQVNILGGIGGLDNNEVAEMVYLEVRTNIDHNQSDNDQDVGSDTRLQFAFGGNLPVNQDFVAGTTGGANQTITGTSNVPESGIDNLSGNFSDERVMVRGRMHKSPAFDDEASGPGGAAGVEEQKYERPWRELVNRGPVFDSSDDLTVQMQLQQDDEIIDGVGSVSLHMIWDVAEVSEAGRNFSVPE